MSKRNQTKVTHADFARLVMRLMTEKESVEKQFAAGKPVTLVASSYNTSGCTFRNACETAGIAVPKRGTITAYNRGGDIKELLERINALERTVAEHSAYIDTRKE